MKTLAFILVSSIILTSCTKTEVKPVDLVRFELEDQSYELELYRFAKVQIPESDLYINSYGIWLDSVVYNRSYYSADIRLRACVYYHPDSTGYTNQLSHIYAEFLNKSDSSELFFFSEICNQSNFKLVIDELEWIDKENGYYSGRFWGDLCDSNQISKLSMVSGEIIRARL